ncbi:MAG: alpha-L-fucosidase [Verrucomicrobiales bacterium]
MRPYRPHLIVLLSAIGLVASFSSAESPEPATKLPSIQETAEQKNERMRWFDEARLGMFIHWGLYSKLGGEWKEKHVTGGAEWIQKYLEIPSSEYMPLANSFAAPHFDAEAWVKAIADAGVKYICVTTKHHDGFCLWPTQLNDDWNISKTPFKRDPIKELSEACKRHGVTFCIYHSILDWHHPDWPGRPPFNDYAKGQPDKERFRAYLHGQLKELFTNYGPIGMIWLDGSWDRQHWTSDDGKQLEDYLRSLQPSVIINNRSGHLPPQPKFDFHIENAYSYVFAGDYISPEGEVPATGLPGIHWETCQTMQLPNNWGYSRITGFRTFTDLLRQFIDVASKGGNLLLNIGPTGEGAIPPQALGCLEKFGVWMQTNREAIYGTTASPFSDLPFDGRCTRKGQTLYFHVFNWPVSGSITIPAVNVVKRAWLLADPEASLAPRTTANGIEITVPESAPDPVAAVIAVEIDGEPRLSPTPRLVSAGIRPEVSSFWPGREAQLDAKFITDGDPNTMWAAGEHERSASVVIALGEPQPLAKILLSDAPYGRTLEFDIEAKTADGWMPVAKGTTIGNSLRVPVDGIRAEAVRLNIRKASDTPTLAEFQIFSRAEN